MMRCAVFFLTCLTSLSQQANGVETGLRGWGNNGNGQITPPPGATNVIAVAAGGDFTLALRADGTVMGWGANNARQSTVPRGLSNVTAIAAGYYHALALRDDGSVVAWGDNVYGQTNVPAFGGPVVAVSAGQYHSVALQSDGKIVCWGRGDEGQTNAPIDYADVVAIAAGYNHNLALRRNGRVIGWGRNANGQAAPPARLDRVVAVVAGGDHSLALRDDGTVTAWGKNDAGQINVPAGLSNVVAIVGNGLHSLALQHDGVVVAWGANNFGQTNVPSPLGHAIAITSGNAHNMALLNDGSPLFVRPPVSKWVYSGATVGWNAVAVGEPPLAYQWYYEDALIPAATNAALILSNVQTVQAGEYTVIVSNAFAVLKSEKLALRVRTGPPVVVTQPRNQSTYPGGGPITIDSAADGTEPLAYQWRLNGADLAGETNIELVLKRVSYENAGPYQMVASNRLGTAVSSNVVVVFPSLVVRGRYGEAAPNCFWAGTGFFFPVDLTNEIAAVDGSYYHSLALQADGRVRVWGWFAGDAGFCFNARGQTNVPPDLTNAVAISAGGFHSLAVRSDGTVAAWGYNISGQCNVPTNLGPVVAVAAAHSYSLALRTDGTVVGWGSDSGTGMLLAANLSNLTDVVALDASRLHFLALKSDGTVVARGFSLNTNVPPDVTNVVAIAAGLGRDLALRADGTVVSWRSVTNWPGDLTNVAAIGSGRNVSSDTSAVLKQDGTSVGLGCCVGCFPGQSECPPPGLTNVVEIGTGSQHVIWRVAPGRLVRSRDLGMSRLRWLTLGDGAWFSQTNVTFDGGDALQSGGIGPGQASKITTTAFGPGTVMFRWKISSQADADALRFSIDGVEKTWISGETDWQERVWLLTDGYHKLEWNYTKDTSVSSGLDAGWIDGVQIVFQGTLAPYLVAQPASPVVVFQGTTTTFTPGAPLGVPPIFYQWLFNGLGIAGATSRVLTINNAQLSDAGNYALVMSNAYGVTISSNVLVTITNGPPEMIVDPLDQVVSLGQDVAFDAVILSGTAPRWFQWRLNGTNLPGATNSRLLLEHVMLGSLGLYSVTVTNELGGVLSSNASYVAVPAAAWGNNRAGATNLLPSLTNLIAVAGGAFFNVGLRDTGNPFAWGDNTYGQINVPADLTDAVNVAAGNGFCLALRANGRIAAWGHNYRGQLNVPVDLADARAIAAGADHALALRANGTVVAWGRNDEGQTIVPPGLTNIMAIAAGGLHSLALDSNGRVWAWGSNARGQTSVPTELSNVVAISAGAFHNLALRKDGQVFAWGDASSGQSVVPPGLSNVVGIAGGSDFSFVLRANGSVAAWGGNVYGQTNAPAKLTNFLVLAAAHSHALGLLGDGTRPLPGTAPRVLNISRIGTQFEVRTETFSGHVYSLESTESLSEPVWVALGSLVAGNGKPKVFRDPVASAAQRFYRIREWK